MDDFTSSGGFSLAGDASFDFARPNAGAKQLRGALKEVGQELKGLTAASAQFNDLLGTGADSVAKGMTRAFEKFARTGSLSFKDLENVAVSALDSIYNSAIQSGINSLFGQIGASGGGGGLLGGLFQSLLSGFSFAPRATGGPVSAGRPYLVGEAGAELFVPRSAGAIMPSGAAPSTGPVNITINLSGDMVASRARTRQSASQIAAQVGQAVVRARRNG